MLRLRLLSAQIVAWWRVHRETLKNIRYLLDDPAPPMERRRDFEASARILEALLLQCFDLAELVAAAGDAPSTWVYRQAWSMRLARVRDLLERSRAGDLSPDDLRDCTRACLRAARETAEQDLPALVRLALNVELLDTWD